MIIAWLDADDLSPAGRRSHVEEPRWEIVEAAIRRLDGFDHTQVCLMRDEGVGFCASGGDNDRFICEIADGETVSVLQNDSGGNEHVAVMKEGSPDFPEAIVVNFDTVLKVARTYFETGKCDDRFSWKK